MIKDDRIPLYAVVSYTGNSWTVHFQLIKNKNSVTSNITHSGYGQFPEDRFPGIPVIDYTNNDAVINTLSIPVDDYPGEVFYHSRGTVQSYIDQIKNMGVPVRGQ